jgi:hypothetical protein
MHVAGARLSGMLIPNQTFVLDHVLMLLPSASTCSALPGLM